MNIQSEAAQVAAAKANNTVAYKVFEVVAQRQHATAADIIAFGQALESTFTGVHNRLQANAKSTKTRDKATVKPALEDICSVRFHYCGSRQQHVGDGDIVAFAQALCLRGFEIPRWGAEFFYHNPAGPPQLRPEVKSCLKI